MYQWNIREELTSCCFFPSLSTSTAGRPSGLLTRRKGLKAQKSAQVDRPKVYEDLQVLDIALDLLIGELTTNETLESEDSIGRVDNCLSLGGETNKTFAVLSESNDGWSSPVTLRVLDDLGSGTLHHGNTRVSGTQVNTDDWSIDFCRLVACDECTRNVL